jgi:hypothetical protein
MLPAAYGAGQAMLAEAFAALEREFEPGWQGPLGLCVPTADPEEMRARPEAEWRDPRLIYAGTGADGRQVRIGYFAGAKIGPGRTEAGATEAEDYPLEPGHRVELFAEQDAVSRQDVIDLWIAEHAMEPDEARRRAAEVFVIGTADGALAGLCTVFLKPNPQLGLACWHYRTFVTAAHRRGNLAQRMHLATRDRLSRRYASGEDTRGAGLIVEIEVPSLKRHHNDAVLQPSDYTFIGENERGDHVRVHWFPGARTPAP